MTPLRADIVTGETVLQRMDLHLPGYIPLTLARTYRSGRAQPGPFGYGWRLNLAVVLRVAPDAITYAPGTPYETVFTPIEEGMQARHVAGALMQHHAEAYVIAPSPTRRFVFEKGTAQGDTLPLSRIEDPNGNSIHFFYDRGALAGIVDTMGRQVRWEYRGGRVSRLRTVDGGSTASTLRTFRYDGQGDLVRETDAEGHAASFEYRRHLMVTYANRNGGTQYAQYDGDRRCLALWQADHSDARRFAYDPARQATRVVQGDGRQTLYRHAHPGQVLERIDARDRSQNYYYDEVRRLIGFSDEHGAVQTFQRLELEAGTGTLLDTEKRVAFLEMDEELRVTQVRDGFDHQQTLVYDAQHRPVELRTPAGAAWRFERNRRGAVTEVAGPAGRSVRIVRHPEERRLVIEDDQERRLEDRFDAHGRLVERIDALQRRFQWRYDANGRLRSVHAGGQSMAFEYAPGGQLTRVVDAAGQKTTLQYDSSGRLTAFAARDRQYQLGYDAARRAVTAAGPEQRPTQIEYTESGRIARIRYPDERTTTYHRTAEGVKAVTEGHRGETVVSYNPSGDPVRWKKPGEPEHLLSYGPSGELMAVDRGERALYIGYDEEGRVVEAREEGRTLELEYAADGGMRAARVDGQEVLACTRDASGCPVSLDGPSQRVRMTYDAAGRVQAIRGEQQRWTFEYDAFDRLAACQREGAAEPALESGAVQTCPLGALAQANGGSYGAELMLHIARHGVALSMRTGAWCIPIWRRGDCLSPVLPLASALTAAALGRGAGPLVASLQPVFAPRLPHRWEHITARGLREDHTEIPDLAELGPSAWASLHLFFLRRPFYEMGGRTPLARAPQSASRRPLRSPDAWVTGTHVAGALRPPIWGRRATGPHLHHRALGPHPGRTDLLDMLEFICAPSPWS